MSTNYDAIDLTYSWNGDYDIGLDGDLADTSSDQIQSLIQQVTCVIASAYRDWEEYPSLGANINNFIGEANTLTLGKTIQSAVVNALTSFNIVQAKDLSVRTVPVGVDSIMILVQINAKSTPNNSLDNNFAVVSLLLDTQEQNIFVI